ncbi:hypothetical protein STEG23_015984, partial [Scotinomys teguina]
MHEGLPAFYRKKAMVKKEQANQQERLMTSNSLESPAEMLRCGKGEQQDSTTFETLHLEKGIPEFIYVVYVIMERFLEVGQSGYKTMGIGSVMEKELTPGSSPAFLPVRASSVGCKCCPSPRM